MPGSCRFSVEVALLATYEKPLPAVLVFSFFFFFPPKTP